MNSPFPLWRFIVACGLCASIGVLGGNIATLLEQRTYTAETAVYVAARTTGVDESQAYLGSLLAKQRTVSYESVATTLDVAQTALSTSQVPDLTPKQLAESVKAYSRTDSVVLEISVTNPSPLRAAILANALEKAFATKVQSLESPNGNPRFSPIEIRAISVAVPPTQATTPSPVGNALIGGIVGLLVGSILGRAAGSLRRRIRMPSDLDGITDTAVVAIPRADGRDAPELAAQTVDALQGSVNRLRLRLKTSDPTSGQSLRMVAITPSTGQVSGWHETATRLADSWTRAGASVVLVDLREWRTLGTEDGGDEPPGLDDVLWGRARIHDVVVGTDKLDGRAYSVIKSGAQNNGTRYPLSSDQARDALRGLLDAYDFVVLSVPSAADESDWLPLIRMTDGVVLAIEEDITRFSELLDATAALEHVGASLSGVAYLSGARNRTLAGISV